MTRSAGFHRDVASAIVHVWRLRQQATGYDVSPERATADGFEVRHLQAGEPGLITWSPSVDGSRPQLATVADMTAAIGRCYDVLTLPGKAAKQQDATGNRLALWVIAVGDLGGVARHVLDATRAGIPGWRITVLCPEGQLAERLRAQGSAVLTAPISPQDPLVGGISAVRHTVRTLRPAVVHSHLAYSDFLAAAATVGLPTRLVTTEHGIAGDDLVYHGSRWRSRVMATAHAVRLRRFDALIAVAGATLDAVRGKWHPPRGLRTVVIPNGVDAPGTSPEVVPGRFHVISLSRLAPEKGLDDLLEAFALVHGRHPEARLTLAGEGPMRAELESRIAKLDLQTAVTMPGYLDAGSLLPEADVLAQLSVWENCSYTLLDAVIHDLAIVATAVGGNRDLKAVSFRPIP